MSRTRRNPTEPSETAVAAEIAALPPAERQAFEALRKGPPWPDELPDGTSEAALFAPKPYKPTDWSDPGVTNRYERVAMPEGFPRFRVHHAPRMAWQNDAQYEAGLVDEECLYRTLGIYLGIAQMAASHLGLHEDCAREACRRAGRCVSRRAEDDWTVFPGPMLPPCCDTLQRTHWVRHMVNVKVAQAKALAPDGGDDA